MDTQNKTLPEYERNPELHLKDLYTFKVKVKKHYTGEDQEVLLEGIERKIKEIKHKIKIQELKDKD
jgi:hypothetical protein